MRGIRNLVGESERVRADREQAGLVAEANHILFHQGVVDAFGHVSARDKRDPDHFLLARNMAPAMVDPSDIQVFDLYANSEDNRRPYLERFIHSEIYRARPDVNAVVHSHSPSVIPFGVSSLPLRPVFHMAGFLAEGVSRFEIRDVAGARSDLLIRDEALGKALARSLGQAPVVLMRGHGSVAVGESLELAVYRAVYTEKNAQLQREAMALGDATFLTSEEGQASAASNASQIGRAWDMWRRSAHVSHIGLSAQSLGEAAETR